MEMKFAITVSPDPERIVNKAQKRSYFTCTTKEQYNVIKAGLRKACIETRLNTLGEDEFMVDVSVYFELNESGMLHCHGIVECDINNINYFKRMVFRELGRVFFKASNIEKIMNACVHIQELDHVEAYRRGQDMVTWKEYCKKDQSEQWLKRYPKYRYYEKRCIGEDNETLYYNSENPGII